MNLNFFLERPLYVIAGKISKVMRNFQGRLDGKIVYKKNEFWNSLFKNKKHFEFQLDTNVKMNLYKDSVLSKLIYEGFEKQELEYLMTVLKEGDCFLDIGSNIGLFSLIASEKVGESGRVICFEPSPNTFERLIENCNLNNFNNIDYRNIGLSDKKGNLTFYISENGHDAWNSFAPSQDCKLESNIQVPVSTLDIELEEVDKSNIKLVKIDVEGWEKFVLNGGRDFFVKFSPIVMVEFTEENTFNVGYGVHEIYDIMQNYGYTWYRIRNSKLVIEIKKMHYPYDNLIAIKNQ